MVAEKGGNSKHLRQDSKDPEAAENDAVRVYGMKFCPFTHRLKLVLAAKGVDYEIININLQSKPSWYFKRDPEGKIPTLEQNGNLVMGSDVASAYVDAMYPGKQLVTTNPLKAAHEKMLLGQWAKSITGYHNYAFGKDDNNDKIIGPMKVKEGFEKVEKYLKENEGPFICGSEPGLTDYILYPHLERIGALIPLVITQFDHVKAYYDKMQDDPAVQACRISDEQHRDFIHRACAGDIDACDIGVGK
ncbi:glutathione S-transferase omega-1-like [Ciona intestinalis]